MGYINLADGSRFDPMDPAAAMPPLWVFCHSLAQQNRYIGHTTRPYSVAEHSVHLYRHPLVQEAGLGRAALIHDFVEMFMSDVPAPFKPLIPNYCEFEHALQRRIFDHFHEPYENLEAVSPFDKRICRDEMSQLFMRADLPPYEPLGIFIGVRDVSWREANQDLYQACVFESLE